MRVRLAARSARLRMPRTILIRRVDNLGDDVIALPVIREIRREYPAATITLMVRPRARSLYHGLADAFVAPVSVAALGRLIGTFDLIFNIHYSMPPDYNPDARLRPGRVHHIGTPDWSKGKHVYRNLLDGLGLHGIRVSYAGPRIHLMDRHAAAAERWAASLEGGNHRRLLVAVNPSSGFGRKRWGLSGFKRVCRWMISELDAQLVILGAEREDAEAAELARVLPARSRTLLVGRPIGFLAAALSNVDLVVSNDSGPAHIASAVGVPSVTIFGPTSPRLWRPVGPKSVVVHFPENCTACGYRAASHCQDQVCLLQIKPAHVVDGILRCIDRHLRGRRIAALDEIVVSRHLEIAEEPFGVILKNRCTGHACVVTRGWPYVSRILRAVTETRSYAETRRRFQEDRHLLTMLFMHRIIVSRRQERCHRPL